jgi:hypothetical protein
MALYGISLVVFFRSRWMGRQKGGLQKVIQFGVSAGIGLIIFIQYAVNQNRIKGQDQYYRIPRDFMVKAYDLGLAQKVRGGSFFVSPAEYNWNNEDLSREISKKVKGVIFLNDFEKKKPEENLKTFGASPLYYLNFKVLSSVSQEMGWALISEIRPKSNSMPKESTDLAFEWIDPVLYLGQVQEILKVSPQITLNCGKTGFIHKVDVPQNSSDPFMISVPKFSCTLKDFQVNFLTRK